MRSANTTQTQNQTNPTQSLLLNQIIQKRHHQQNKQSNTKHTGKPHNTGNIEASNTITPNQANNKQSDNQNTKHFYKTNKQHPNQVQKLNTYYNIKTLIQTKTNSK